MNEENLWGDLPIEEKIETPASILRAQAVALKKATKGILDARVVQGTWDDDLTFEFRIVAPALGNYSAAILEIRQPITLYPLRVTAPMMDGFQRVENAEEFKETLKTVLQSQKVRQIVSGLLTQSHDAGVATKSSPASSASA